MNIIKRLKSNLFLLTLGVASTGFAAAEDRISLHSVEINSANNTVKIQYSKDFNTCAHLIREDNSLAHWANIFCTSGENLVFTKPSASFKSLTLGEPVKLCNANNRSSCSDVLPVTQQTDSEPENQIIDLYIDEATIDINGYFSVRYDNRSASECLNLTHFDGTPVIESPTFCGSGDALTGGFAYKTLLQNKVKMCAVDDASICSNIVPVDVPSHPLSFHVNCDMAAQIASEIGDSFNCTQPSQKIYNELGRRLKYYADDVNTIFSKRSIRHYDFNPETGIRISDQFPSGFCCSNPQPPMFGYNAVVEIKPSDKGYSYGGTAGIYTDGSVVSKGSYWDTIHDGSLLTVETKPYSDYWRQISTISHEFAHSFYVALGEYYNLATVVDNSGVAPLHSISYRNPDGPFWKRHKDYFNDPMFGAYRSKSGAYSRDEMFDVINFADVSIAVMNRPVSVPTRRFGTTVDLALPTTIKIIDAGSGQAIQGAAIRVWNVHASTYEITERDISNPITNSQGEIVTNLDMAFGNTSYLKLVKINANGYQAKAYWHQVYDLQEDFLIKGKSTHDVVIEMESDIVNAWESTSDALGGVRTSFGWDFALGYHFSPDSNGKIIKLGGLFDGEKQVKLFERATGNLLADTTVSGSYEDFNYSAISPVSVQSDKEYTVAVYSTSGSGASYQRVSNVFPISVNGITISSSTYLSTRNNPNAIPTNSATGYMYGMADVAFSPDDL